MSETRPIALDLRVQFTYMSLCIFTDSWQAIENVIALSRNTSQICDKCYMIKRHIMKNQVQLIAYVERLSDGGFDKWNSLWARFRQKTEILALSWSEYRALQDAAVLCIAHPASRKESVNAL